LLQRRATKHREGWLAKIGRADHRQTAVLGVLRRTPVDMSGRNPLLAVCTMLAFLPPCSRGWPLVQCLHNSGEWGPSHESQRGHAGRH